MAFIMANILPKERGIYLIFFPIMLLGIALGDERKVISRFIFPMISITLLITLEFTNYQVFGEINVNKGDVDKSFLINLISSATLLVLTAAFLIRNNQRAERILKDNQEKLRNMADEIEQKNEVLSKTNAELDRFVYSTSHDLRSPLMSILGLINVAKYEKSSAELKKYFEKIQDRVNSLNNFIADILDYSRNTRQEVAPELVELRSGVRSRELARRKARRGTDRPQLGVSAAQVVEVQEKAIEAVGRGARLRALRQHRDMPRYRPE